MAFDDTNFRDPLPEAPPSSPKISKRGEAFILGCIMFLAVAALVLPISAASFSDIVRAFAAR